MAVSGSQKTKVAGYMSGVGKKQTFTAKAPGSATTASLLLMNRSIARVGNGGMR